MNELLYLEEEQEGTTAVIPLIDLQTSHDQVNYFPTALPSEIHRDYPSINDGDLLTYCHQTTAIEELVIPAQNPPPNVDKYNFPFCLKLPTKSSPINWENGETGQDLLAGLETTMLKRRSTRHYTGANITFDQLKAVLDFTYHPEHYLDQGLDDRPDYCDLDLISTFIAVSGVTGLDEGCYYYAVKAQELRQIRFKNFRQELHYLCLGQELGRDAGAVLFHTANLSQGVERYGDRAYRYLHLDAGHLGQKINLAAIHLGLGVSGIGGFFDDQVNDVLGIPVDEAVLYITTLGNP
jgi:SagB-type dehydrogenase family enzyme